MKELDKKDKKLLYELFRGGRAPVTAIASRIGLSKEAVHYRLKRLQKDGILDKIVPIIDFAALGYSTYRMQILLTPEGKIKKQELEDEFKKFKSLSWIVRLSGSWDYALLFNSKTNVDFSKGYEEFIGKLGSYIDKKISSLVFSITHLPPTYLFEGERTPLIQEMKIQHFTLDENQKKIINLLQEDGRMPLLEMARRMKVSVSTIKYHLNLLEKKKIVFGYKPLIKIKNLEHEHFKINIELSDPNQKKLLREKLLMNPNTVYITDAWGKYDLEFESQYKNIHKLLEFMENLEKELHIRQFEIIFSNEEILVNALPGDAM